MSERDAKRLRRFLESREFYEIAQRYRHAPAISPHKVVDAYEALKQAVLTVVAGGRPPEASQP